MSGVDVAPIEIQTAFETFAEFWHPFTLGAGPAPGYYVSLDAAHQQRLRAVLAEMLGAQEPVVQTARAWGVRKVNS